MAYMTIQIKTGSNGPALGDLNFALSGGVSKPEEVIQNVVNILSGVQAGTIAAEIAVSSSSNANISISAGGVFSGLSGTGAVNISNPPLNFK